MASGVQRCDGHRGGAVFSQKGRKRTPLPDELIIEILLRLPADDVFRFRNVSPKWRALTSSTYFSKAYLRHSTLALLRVDCVFNYREELEYLLVGEGRIHIRKALPESTLSKSPYGSCSVKFSQDGILLFEFKYYTGRRRRRENVVWNPITGEERKISNPDGGMGQIYAIFFPPILEEYCLLWGQSDHPHTMFKILNLGSEETQWKEIEATTAPPSTFCRLRQNFQYRHGAAPAIVDDRIHWILGGPLRRETILVYDIKKEEFSVMPHPEPDPSNKCIPAKLFDMYLFKTDDDNLSLVHNFSRTRTSESCVIKIWTLKNYEERSWIRSHAVNTPSGLSSFTSFEVLAMRNGELILRQREEGNWETIVACNLELGTKRTISSGNSLGGRMAHFPSLATLRR